MPTRKLRTAVLAAALALAVPAYADEPEGDGVNAGIAGAVVSTDSYTLESGTGEIRGACDFAGLIVPVGQDGGGQIVRFSGTVATTGHAVATLTNVTCEIRTDDGHMHSQDFQMSGSSATTVGSTVTDESLIWPLAPITVCVSGKSVFGPTPVVEVTLTKRCRRP
jgi:hypothetical protein